MTSKTRSSSDGPHLVELFEQAFQDAALDDRLPLLAKRWPRN